MKASATLCVACVFVQCWCTKCVNLRTLHVDTPQTDLCCVCHHPCDNAPLWFTQIRWRRCPWIPQRRICSEHVFIPAVVDCAAPSSRGRAAGSVGHGRFKLPAHIRTQSRESIPRSQAPYSLFILTLAHALANTACSLIQPFVRVSTSTHNSAHFLACRRPASSQIA